MKAKSFSQITPFESNLFESTGIRELTPEEIDLVNGACSLKERLSDATATGNEQIIPGMAAGLVGGALVGQPVQGALIGGITGWVHGFASHMLDGCSCVCAI